MSHSEICMCVYIYLNWTHFSTKMYFLPKLGTAYKSLRLYADTITKVCLLSYFPSIPNLRDLQNVLCGNIWQITAASVSLWPEFTSLFPQAARILHVEAFITAACMPLISQKKMTMKFKPSSELLIGRPWGCGEPNTTYSISRCLSDTNE